MHGTPGRFGVQTEKGRVIYVFRNGDRFHAGYKMTVHSTKYKTMDQARKHNRSLDLVFFFLCSYSLLLL